MYQVDAFSKPVFSGNPAAVIKLDAFLPGDLMQNIAQENNLSETAYVVPREQAGHYDLRWFTPALEIDFCGHATIATAHTLYAEYGLTPPFHFHTQVGELIVQVSDGLYHMDAPVFRAQRADITPAMKKAFDAPLKAAFHGSDNLFLVFENEADVRRSDPDMALVKKLSDHGVGITAQGSGEYDCVSRFFVPAQGIDEDPVTGSAHAAIGPYWATQLGRTKLTAYQASERGGTLYLDVGRERLTISGFAKTYMKGEIYGV
jgi:PhzF family phenazine biosynthesis protein